MSIWQGAWVHAVQVTRGSVMPHVRYMKSWNGAQIMRMRKSYVPLYIQCLQDNKQGGNDEIADMDRQLPEVTILVFRRLAHAKVSSVFRLKCCATMHHAHCMGHNVPVTLFAACSHQPCGSDGAPTPATACAAHPGRWRGRGAGRQPLRQQSRKPGRPRAGLAG